MVAGTALWSVNDPNLAVLPLWSAAPGATLTAPFVDTHVAVRFLGGVSNYSEATAADCVDVVGPRQAAGVDRPGIWCDLVVRASTGKLTSRFDLVSTRLDHFVHNGIDVMIVLDNVPWAFVNVTSEPCASFGCQYLPPDDPDEFGLWVGELATHIQSTYGAVYANDHVSWRLGTEANGPRWSDQGKYYPRYLASYKAVMHAVRRVLPRARVGASNWVEVVRTGASGNFTPGGNDGFQYDFYGAVGADPTVPLDWISISHYGGGGNGEAHGANFPGPDYIQHDDGRLGERTNAPVELQAMRMRARRPNATLEIQEWSILNNEKGRPTWEPSSLGAAWSAASVARWVCAGGVDKIFHWEAGTTVTNLTTDPAMAGGGRNGDGRLVNFYEQWGWNMAFLELFIGGQPRFATFDLPPVAVAAAGASPAAGVSAAPTPAGLDTAPAGVSVGAGVVLNNTIAVFESAKAGGELFLLVAALANDRNSPFQTTFQWNTSALHDCNGGERSEAARAPAGARPSAGAGAAAAAPPGAVQVHQYRMNSSTSVVETIVADLAGKPGMLLRNDGLPYDLGRLLTPKGFAYVQRPENLDRYWEQQKRGFQPGDFEGNWSWADKGRSGSAEFQLRVELTAPSVTVLVAKCK
jgi:hypothetical protein